MLRIEDTDRERSTPENVEQILDALRWLELDWDEGPLSQAERSRSPPRADRGAGRGRARLSGPRDRRGGAGLEGGARQRGYRGEPRPGDGAAIRLRVPDEGETVVEDLIRGPVRFENRLQDDLVIARGDGTPLYNFAVAVDDAEMGITDVIRGDDHLSNTPKQLLVLEALGVTPPRYAHLPLLHGPDGKKLSKRHGAASVQELRDAGYLPAAVRNYLALLGWGTEDDTTILSTDELVERFAIERVGRASAIFDEQKLRWLNGRFMRELPLDDYVEAVARPPRARRPRATRRPTASALSAACAIAQDKAQTLDEVWPLIAFLFEPTGRRRSALVEGDEAGGGRRGSRRRSRRSAICEPVRRRVARARARARGRARSGQSRATLYQPVRVAITGTTVSPGHLRFARRARARALGRTHRSRARAVWR